MRQGSEPPLQPASDDWRQRRPGAAVACDTPTTSLRPPHPHPVQDLLPAELAGSRKRGASPMRACGSPPKAAAPPPAPAPAAPVPVDGVPEAAVDAWFRLADADGDGRVADSEARDFFLTSGLAPADLSKVRGGRRGGACQAVRMLAEVATERECRGSAHHAPH